MKFMLLAITIVTMAIHSFATGKEIESQKEQTSSPKAPAENIIFTNKFLMPIFFGIYDVTQGELIKEIGPLAPRESTTFEKNFFATQLPTILKDETKKFLVACSYAEEVHHVRTSYYQGAWVGILLEVKDILALNESCKNADKLWITMILLGQQPILCCTALPAKTTYLFFPSQSTKGETLKQLLENDLYEILWGEEKE